MVPGFRESGLNNLAIQVAPDNEPEIKALEADRGNYLGYVRLVGRRRAQAKLSDQIVSFPAQYTRKPLLLSEEY